MAAGRRKVLDNQNSSAAGNRGWTEAPQTSRRIALVDDHAAIRESVTLLFKTVGIAVVSFNEPSTFLRSPLDDIGCILLDVRLPEMGGVQVFRMLRERKVTTPVIFLTGHGDIQMAVRAMQDGAFDFLEKPIDDQILIESVLAGLRRDADLRNKRELKAHSSERVARLTARERQVADLIVSGQTSKEIADHLSISQRTVEHYRIKISRKLEITSVTELVRVLDGLAD